MKTMMFVIIVTVGRIGAAQTSSATNDVGAAFRLRGDDAVERGDFDGAIDGYKDAYDAGGHKDLELLKRMATLYEWMRGYTKAKELLGTVIGENPSDEEATMSLTRLQNRRGLQLSGGYGEGEIDYTKRVYSLQSFYGGIDWLDLHAGFSQSSKLVYDRSDLWFDAFLFPTYRSYLRLGVRQKEYTYPVSAIATPDNSAYARVPDYQLEIGYYYFRENYVSIEAEYFAPNFFWNNDLHAHNYKIGGSLRQWITKPVYARFFAASLHDPDPQSVISRAPTNRITGFAYESVTLIGGALGFDNERVNAEMKYIPDRDLDHSLDWSLLATLRINADAFRAQYDFLYDKYPSSSTRPFSGSQVHMLTAILEPAAFLELKIGAKAMIQNVTTLLPFVALQLNTGM